MWAIFHFRILSFLVFKEIEYFLGILSIQIIPTKISDFFSIFREYP